MDLGMSKDVNGPNSRWSSWVLMAGLLAAGAIIFCTGITWGLPSRDVDPFLFGAEPAWPGEKIQRLAGERTNDPTRGADVDVNPVVAVGRSVVLNETDEQRAEIIRRYRLFSYHPDEMVTLMALASMRPGSGDFDPRLYQYGGLWIYPVGLLLRVAAACGAITLTGDVVYYLDRPEEFGRFYVVARLYVVAWALVGVWAVYHLARQLNGGSRLTGVMAALGFMLMPVVVTVTHEAKPHLPGAVLTLLAVLAAMRYVENGRHVWGLLASVLAGAAFGMVLNAWPALLIPLTMIFLRKQAMQVRIGMMWRTMVVMLATYFITNPYVLMHLIGNRALLRSNLGNTGVMFTIGSFTDSMRNGFLLMAEGVSPVLFGAGLCVVAIFGWKTLKKNRLVGHNERDKVGVETVHDRKGTWPLLWVPALGNLVPFTLFAGNQDAAYGRFALLADMVLCMAAVVILGRMVRHGFGRVVILSFLLAATAFAGYDYLQAFQNDTRGLTSRLATACNIRQLEGRATALGVFNNPAPYSVPPVNLFHWRLELLPEDFVSKAALPEVLTGTMQSIEKNFSSRANLYTAMGYFGSAGIRDMICWADEGMICLIRAEPNAMTTQEEASDAP